MLNQIFGAQKQNYGNTEFWHGAERSGWLMKQGEVSIWNWDSYQYDIIRRAHFEGLSACFPFCEAWAYFQGQLQVNTSKIGDAGTWQIFTVQNLRWLYLLESPMGMIWTLCTGGSSWSKERSSGSSQTLFIRWAPVFINHSIPPYIHSTGLYNNRKHNKMGCALQDSQPRGVIEVWNAAIYPICADPPPKLGHSLTNTFKICDCEPGSCSVLPLLNYFRPSGVSAL